MRGISRNGNCRIQEVELHAYTDTMNLLARNNNLRFSRHEHTRQESHRQHTPKIAGIKPLPNHPFGPPKKKQGALILLLDSQDVNRTLNTQYKGEKEGFSSKLQVETSSSEWR